jgi:hypothetical protein
MASLKRNPEPNMIKHVPLSASQMRRVATLAATTRQIISASRVQVTRLWNLDLAAGTGNLKHDGKLYAAERVGQFWYLTGDYTTL